MKSYEGIGPSSGPAVSRADGPPQDPRYQVQSVGRALDIVTHVADGPPGGLSLSEISALLGLAKSSVLAIVRTLIAHGYLRAIQPGRRYGLGPGLIRLGYLSSEQFPIAEICNPILREITAETLLTARAAVSDDGSPLFVDRVDGPGTVRFYTPLGYHEPAHATAAGKAILATLTADQIRAKFADSGLPAHSPNTITSIGALLDQLAAIRQRGYAVDDEEDVPGVACIGAAFFNHQGCAGALSVTGLKVELPGWRIEMLGMRLRQHADRVSVLVGGRPYADLEFADQAGM